MEQMASPVKEEEMDTDLDESADSDIKTAQGLLGSMVLAPEGEQALVKALSGSNPPKMVAMFLMQGIEMIQTKSMQTDTPLDPRIWLANGGVVDETMVDVAEIAADNNIPIQIGQFIPLVKQELAKTMSQRGEQLKGEGQQQAPPQEQASQGAPPNMAAPSMGGM